MTELALSELSDSYTQKNKKFSLPIANIDKKNSVFRPIHYLGSKLRLLDELDYFVNNLAPDSNTLCDLFAGSGTVSQHFIKTHNVISVDIQEYSKVISSAISAPSNSKNFSPKSFRELCEKSDLNNTLISVSRSLQQFELDAINVAIKGDFESACDLLEDGCIEFYKLGELNVKNPKLYGYHIETNQNLRNAGFLNSVRSLTLRYFGGIYFSYLQACNIDAILDKISELPEVDRNTFLAALLSTVSEIVNTVGKQFAQPIKPRKADGTPKASLKTQLKRDRFLDVFTVFEKWLDKYLNIPAALNEHISIKSDYASFLSKNTKHIDIFYADPPYTRDHYSRYYHILETICLRDNPKISTVKIRGKESLSRGIYREDRHQSAFCIKSQALNAFKELFEKVRAYNAPLLISYSPFAKESNNRPRVLGVDDITNLAHKYFNKVEVHAIGKFSHSKLNHSEKNYENISEAEVIISCEV